MKESSYHDIKMSAYCQEVHRLEDKFDSLELNHIPRCLNEAADALAKAASDREPVPMGVFASDQHKPSVRHEGLEHGEDASWHQFMTRCCFCKCVDRLIEAPWDVIEFEAVESVLQSSDLLVVRSHLGVMAARLLHDLVDDQLGVALDVEALDAQLDGNA